jgi:hypothetical protein
MKGIWISYTAEELTFIEEHSRDPRAEMHAAFIAEFGRDDISLMNLHSLCKRKGWMTGRTGCYVKGQEPPNKGVPCPPGKGGRHPNARASQFKSGGLPHNTNYLGHERVSKDGYVEISVDETNPHTGFERRYVLKHRWLWEKAHGPVPEGMALKCRGERTNTNPANWELIPRALLPRLSGRFGRGYDTAPADLKPTIMAVAKLEHRARERARAS